MTGEIIKSFLVGLGFEVDESSFQKFNKSLTIATLKVAALAGAIDLSAAGIAKGITSISKDFEELGYQYRIIYPALNKAIVLRRELFKAYDAAGINLQRTVLSALKLNLSLSKTKIILETLYKSVGARFFPLLTKQSDLFRAKIYANLPKIQAQLEHLVRGLFKAVEAVTALAQRAWSILTRVYDFFVLLDKKTDGWSTTILEVIAAWELLNSAFLATPLGRIVAAITAILILFDDYKTFIEGGKSLLDWSKYVPIINSVVAQLRAVLHYLQAFGRVLGDVAAAIHDLFSGNLSGAINDITEAFKDSASFFKYYLESILNVRDAIANTLDLVGKLLGFKNLGSSILGNSNPENPAYGRDEIPYAPKTEEQRGFFDKVFNFFGNLSKTNLDKNLEQNPTYNPRGIPYAPLSSGGWGGNSQSNSVQLKTDISIQGVSDVDDVGRIVASSTEKSNFDFIQNLGSVLGGGLAS